MQSSSSETPAVENIYWIEAPPGRYEWWVHNYSKTNTPVNFWVREKHKGKVIMHQGNTGTSNNSPRKTINYQNPLTVHAQTRLQTSIDCIKNIIKDELNDDDKIGLMTFATDVRTEFEPMAKGQSLGHMLGQVDRMKTRGKTACYKAIRQAAEKLKNRPNAAEESKWVVVLTDGKDTSSDASDVPAAVELFKNTDDLNFALISLGNEVDVSTVNRIVSGAQQRDNTGMLVSANSMDDVRKAFADIAETMLAPSAGASG